MSPSEAIPLPRMYVAAPATAPSDRSHHVGDVLRVEHPPGSQIDGLRGVRLHRHLGVARLPMFASNASRRTRPARPCAVRTSSGAPVPTPRSTGTTAEPSRTGTASATSAILVVRGDSNRGGDRLVRAQPHGRAVLAGRLRHGDFGEPAGVDLHRVETLRYERPLGADHLDSDPGRRRAGVHEHQGAGGRARRHPGHELVAPRGDGRFQRVGAPEDGRGRVERRDGERAATSFDPDREVGFTGSEVAQVDASNRERIDHDAVGVDRVDLALRTPERDVGDGRRRRQDCESTRVERCLPPEPAPTIPAVVDGRRARPHDQSATRGLVGDLAEEPHSSRSPAALVHDDPGGVDRVVSPRGRVAQGVEGPQVGQALGGRGRSGDDLTGRQRHPVAGWARVGRAGDRDWTGRSLVVGALRAA